ncbi:MAG: hypothetical protein R8G66_34780 [Cytophagales bacterium]|nr:hypothetical protein [Cytophagales bacterium]
MEALPSGTRPAKTAEYTFLFILLSSIAFLGLAIARYETATLLTIYGVAFFTYVWIVRLTNISWKVLFVSGFLIRIALMWSLPNLSDDFYRFIWDGTLLKHGINPFGVLPDEAIKLDVPGIDQAFYTQLNSPNYFTIYPPLNQAIFWLSAQIGGPGNWLLSVNVMRLFLIGSDIGTFFLLKSLLHQHEKSIKNAFWFFLNPLVILEFTGNLHFEGLVIFFLILGVHQYDRSKTLGQGFGFAGAISAKLVPLIFLPAVLMKQWPKKGILVCFLAVFIALITFIPMIGSALVSGMSSSIGLYFQSFEFNASIYFIIREIGFMIVGWNMIQQIGPWLGITTFILIMTWVFVGSRFKKDLPMILMGSLVIYLLLSTTVHPWYVLPLIPLGILSGFYFPVVWSLMIFLTYIGYATEDFHLPMHWIILEYLTVISVMSWEFVQHSKKAKNENQ